MIEENNQQEAVEITKGFSSRLNFLNQDRHILEAEYQALSARAHRMAAELDRQHERGLIQPTTITQEHLVRHNQVIEEILEAMLANTQLIARYFEAYQEDVQKLGVPLIEVGREIWPELFEDRRD